MTSRSAARLIRTVAIVAAIAGPCAGFAACGLDENGVLVDATPGVDVLPPIDTGIDSPPDVVVDNYVPPACASLDASCLGSAIPDGWVPVGLLQNNPLATPCPGDSEDFDQRDWATNARPHFGACTCGICTTSGAWTCAGNVSVATGGNGCSGTLDTFPAGPHCTTSVTSTGNNQIAGSLPTIGGSATCDASVTGNGQVDTTPIRTCTPLQCTTDYCGLANQGFKLCILYNGDTGGQCPSGFVLGVATSTTTPGQLDLPQNAQVTCNACSCSVGNPGTTCTATLRTFSSTDCDGDGGTGGGGFMDAYAAQGINTCLPVNNSGVQSVFYLPGSPPKPTCANTSSGGGTASFKAPVTVCCKP